MRHFVVIINESVRRSTKRNLLSHEEQPGALEKEEFEALLIQVQVLSACIRSSQRLTVIYDLSNCIKGVKVFLHTKISSNTGALRVCVKFLFNFNNPCKSGGYGEVERFFTLY